MKPSQEQIRALAEQLDNAGSDADRIEESLSMIVKAVSFLYAENWEIFNDALDDIVWTIRSQYGD